MAFIDESQIAKIVRNKGKASGDFGVHQAYVSRDFKQIGTAADSTAVMVGEVWVEYVTVARKNSTLSNAQREIVWLG